MKARPNFFFYYGSEIIFMSVECWE